MKRWIGMGSLAATVAWVAGLIMWAGWAWGLAAFSVACLQYAGAVCMVLHDLERKQAAIGRMLARRRAEMAAADQLQRETGKIVPARVLPPLRFDPGIPAGHAIAERKGGAHERAWKS